MSEKFTDITFQTRYRSGDYFAKPREFYNLVLPCTRLYQRAVGFFSSTSFLEISYGILSLVKNDGKMQLITSPRLNADDVEAIKKGYESREKIYLKAFTREMTLPKTINEQNRLNILANLIENGILEIKIAVTEKPEVSMYHEKIGLFIDGDGNKVAISGSMNESETAISENFESFQVFCSWYDRDSERVQTCEKDFNSMWENKQNALEVFDFPELPKALIQKYRTSKKTTAELKEDFLKEQFSNEQKKKPLSPNTPTMPDWLKLHDYQKEAIEKWAEQNYRGIFDMATGTGKTLTGLSALTRLFEDKCGEKLFAIIVCPYQHLVEQWVEDIVKFNIKPIIGYSASPQNDWKDRLRDAVIDIGLKSLKKNFFCFICTNATFSSKYVQEQLSRIRVQKILIVDEAHNFGAPYLSKWLLDSYEYRIGLSATINRHGDEEGTEKLFDFFGEKCIEYDIERAIKEKKLTPYKYYPVLVYLDDEELSKYKRLTKEIKNNQIVDKKGRHKLSKYGEILAMERARIIAGTSSKIPTLKEKILPYKNDTHILVYCGATTILTQEEDTTSVDEKEERQIVAISRMLGNELGIKNHHFTSNENVKERNELKERFTNGDLQALVAIKCLDEGVNIPKIKTAFILASTTNPKEYIQRRGRVLRLAAGKDFAEIYDFITLPYPLENVSSLTEYQVNEVKSLVKRELLRAEEFAKIAKNWGEAESILNEIRDAYNVRLEINAATEMEVFDE